MAGLEFLFSADFSKITRDGLLIALGHSFFTLSLGMGAIMVYGSYLPQNTSIAKTSITIAGLDTIVALLAGMAIFPIVFVNGLEPGAGPGLIFQTLPIAFGHMPGGVLFGTLFFVLLVFAAWSSSISLGSSALMCHSTASTSMATARWDSESTMDSLPLSTDATRGGSLITGCSPSARTARGTSPRHTRNSWNGSPFRKFPHRS